MAQPRLDVYGTTYKQMASEIYAAIRTQVYGEDLGQTGTVTADEHDLFLSWLGLKSGDRLLDVACGSGGLTLRAVANTGCQAYGVDINADAIEAAQRQANETGLADRATFQAFDAGTRLPFDDDSFDALICLESINHLPDRAERLNDWARVLRPGGRVVFTDNIVVTGPISNEEIAVRSSIGYYLFVPPGLNDQLLEAAGFSIVEKEDRTEHIAQIARNWREARQAREAELREIEGDDFFDGFRQAHEVTERLSSERRLSRLAYCAQLR
jgi:ubiquinone/menaquinone biosynthesis C-methylase UbiE